MPPTITPEMIEAIDMLVLWMRTGKIALALLAVFAIILLFIFAIDAAVRRFLPPT